MEQWEITELNLLYNIFPPSIFGGVATYLTLATPGHNSKVF
jgi:hypothetical protein